MKFKRVLGLLLSVAFLLTNFGCNSSKPSDVVNEFSTRIKNKDVENIEELFTEKFKKNNSNVFESLKRNINDEDKLAKQPELTSFEIEKEEIIVDRASVITKSISTTGSVKNSVYVLTKEKDGWKIDDFDLNPGSISSSINNFLKKSE